MGYVRRTVLNTLNRSHANSVQLMRQLRRWETLTADEVKNMQKERLCSLLLHTHRNVPYYRELFNRLALAEPSGRIPPQAIEKIPVLDRETLRERYQDLQSDDLSQRQWYENFSGGSTGEPVRFIQDKTYDDWNNAAWLLYNLWSGHRRADRQVALWGSERDLFGIRGRPIDAAKDRIIEWLNNTVKLNAFRMTPERMRIYVDAINSHRPVQILAYAESIYELSRYIVREHLRIWSPRSVITSAGTLYPEMRRTIEDVFQTRVFNFYGSREVGGIACECENHIGLHVSTFTQYVEILKSDGSLAQPGETGEVVVTNLANYAMPLIRYRIGDTAAWAETPCSCGRGSPLLKNVSGRTTDTFVRRDGTVVLPETLIHLVGVVLKADWIRKFQIVQEDFDRVRLLIACRVSVSSPQERYRSEISELLAKIRVIMGEDCALQVDFVPDIPVHSSGKYRYTISKMNGQIRTRSVESTSSAILAL